ncbi:MAG TPA: FKBP-type peptidyl-prolyl cis-trans isomerase [Cyclobacteriaceae bacterium]|jgi:FKBP-type peptidyl-prolyl cis-trans isomerase|nr:FKBP-type peptidyl-prolyl cis-trans isomerase [Cyclobacteriaceae bacterium]
MKLKWIAGVGFIAVVLSSCLDTPNNAASNQFTKDTTSIRNYIDLNGISATKLPLEGVWFAYDQVGSGGHANFTDTVTLTYKTRLLSTGAVVEDYTSTPVTVNLFNLAPGVQIALPLFPVGSKGRIYIPSYYGYKGTSTATIPANSNLIVEFSLLGVTDHQLKVDTVTINKYVKDKGLSFVRSDASGIRYSIDTVGTGLFYPTLSDSIACDYTVKLLDGTTLQQSSATLKFPLADLILAWKIMLPQFAEGTTITMYTPSSYAYGSNPTSATIPSNANLIFNVKLVKVIRH